MKANWTANDLGAYFIKCRHITKSIKFCVCVSSPFPWNKRYENGIEFGEKINPEGLNVYRNASDKRSYDSYGVECSHCSMFSINMRCIRHQSHLYEIKKCVGLAPSVGLEQKSVSVYLPQLVWSKKGCWVIPRFPFGLKKSIGWVPALGLGWNSILFGFPLRDWIKLACCFPNVC